MGSKLHRAMGEESLRSRFDYLLDKFFAWGRLEEKTQAARKVEPEVKKYLTGVYLFCIFTVNTGKEWTPEKETVITVINRSNRSNRYNSYTVVTV